MYYNSKYLPVVKGLFQTKTSAFPEYYTCLLVNLIRSKNLLRSISALHTRSCQEQKFNLSCVLVTAQRLRFESGVVNPVHLSH